MFTNTRILKVYSTDIPDPIISKNRISGTINEANNSDKSIWVYDRNSGELLAHTMVDRETRKWEVCLDEGHNDESLFIVCRDEGGDYNGDMFDYVSLCTTEYEPIPSSISMTEFPERRLVREIVFPSTTMQYYKCTVPELKGDIVKVVQDSGDTLRYVDADNNTITNAVTENNVLVNDNSIVLNKEINKHLKGSFLKTWRKDIFNDGSEVFHPVFDGKGWKNFYTNSLLTFPGSGHISYSGRYGDMALVSESVSYTQCNRTGAHSGFSCGDATALTISFHGLINGQDISQTVNDYNLLEQYKFIQLVNAQFGTFYFSIGSSAYGKSTRNNVLQTIVGSSGVSTTISDSMYGGNPFRLTGIWHHYVIVITTTSLKVYVDNILIIDRTFSNTPIPKDCIFIIGRNGQHHGYDNSYLGGRISGIRIFNREVTQQEIDTLYNDRPIIEQDVYSIKGMEYSRWNNTLYSQDKSFLFLGGCPFEPLYKYFLYKETYPDGKETYCYASSEKYQWLLSPHRTPLLRENYVSMARTSISNNSNSYWAGLSSRFDTIADQDMGVNMNDIEVEVRCRLWGEGYLFKIGNYNNGCLYINKESGDGRLTYRFKGKNWNNLYYSQPSEGWNSWIRVRWYANKLCVFEDDGTTLLGSASSDLATFDNTLGQISVGCKRGGDSYSSDVYDGNGIDGDISDVIIYKKGTMPSPENEGTVTPVIYKEYKFGYERDGLAGLYLYSTAELPVADSVDATYKVRFGTVNRGMVIKNWSTAIESKDVTIMAYYNIDSNWFYDSTTNFYNRNIYIFHAASNYIIGFNDNFCQFKGVSTNMMQQASFVLDEWNMLAVTVDSSSTLKTAQAYTDGQAGSTIDNYEFIIPANNHIHIESTDYGGYNDYNDRIGCASDRIHIYDKVLPPSVIRNLYQNFNRVTYKNDMQVALIEDNNDYPVYKDATITKVSIKGYDNEQIMTFAFTTNNVDYYIYSSGWKKIASADSANDPDKWRTIATAMEDSSNRMTIARVNSLTANQIAELYDPNVGVFNIAVGMKSDGTVSPYLEDIQFNTEKIWLSDVYNLSDFSDSEYITKTFLQKFTVDGQQSGLKLYSHVSGYDGWQEIQPFAPVPNINQGVQNNGTVQFKVTFAANKHDTDKNTFFEVLIK